MRDIEFGAVLATSTVPPYHVEEILAAWREEDSRAVENAFVVRLRNGQFAYMWQVRGKTRDYVSSSTELFSEEPTHIYRRARRWEFDKEKLNGTTQVGKQQAKYPADAGVDITKSVTGSSPEAVASRLGGLLHSR